MMKKFFSFMAGAITGGLLGAAIALLFAPSSGKILRTKVSEYIFEITDNARQAAQEKKEELEEKFLKLRESA